MTRQELREQWKSKIEAYRISGLTQAAFCQKEGVSIHQLHYWLRKEAKPPVPAGGWLPVEINKQLFASDCTSLSIKIGPAIVEVKPGFDQRLLQDVLETLMVLC